MPPKLRLIVGVDYGTTYSGLSYARSDITDLKDIHPWQRYPDSNGRRAERDPKAPSIVALPEDNEDQGLDKFQWGFKVEPQMKSRQWVKLMLDGNAHATKYDDSRASIATREETSDLPAGWTPARIVTETLRGLHDTMWERLGIIFGERVLQTMPIDVWVTVPAVWSERAKLLTKTAAKDAGFASRTIDTIQLIAEPEAAAHISVRVKLTESDELVEVGSGLLVCDAGGGTVDITTYKVRSTKPQLILDEICPGAGGKCGASFLDRNFHDLMISRFGDAYLSLDEEDRGAGSGFMDQFEMHKRDFSEDFPSNKSTKLNLDMPQVYEASNFADKFQQHYNEKRKAVQLCKEDWKQIFDPVINNVISLVLDQVGEAAKVQPIQTLVLVGGFGESSYLQARLRDVCRPRGIRFTTPWKDMWSAVSCGAVLCGLMDSFVRERKCRKHIGIAFDVPFSQPLHGHISPKGSYGRIYEDEMSSIRYISCMMQWSFSKGRVILETTDVDVPFQELEWVVGFDPAQIRTLQILISSEDVAPEVMDDSTIESVGNVKYTLSNIDLSSQMKFTSRKGRKYYKFQLVCRLRLADRAGHMTMRILHQGNEIGKGELEL